VSRQEALRRPGVAAGLHQNVKHNAVLIDGAPEIMLFTVDPNEDFVGTVRNFVFGRCIMGMKEKPDGTPQRACDP
jgi:hypothetical protein